MARFGTPATITTDKVPSSKPTVKTRQSRTAVARARSTTMLKPSRTRVTKEQKLNAQSATQTKEAVPAIAQQSDTTAEQSPKPPALYKAPHARSNKFPRANGKKEGLQTYSRIPLHLRTDVPAQIPLKTRADTRSGDSTDQNGKVTANKPLIQTRVGRQILTPARFVQLVHVVMAASDIYGGPSCANHINNL